MVKNEHMPTAARLLRIIFLAGFFCASAPLLSSSLTNAATNDIGGTEKAYLFEHPRQGYFIGVPVNVILQDRGEQRGIALKSRLGYQITVQTNATNPEFNLEGMLKRMESKYLGNGKPWSRKFEQGETRVDGLNAISASYEGAGVRVHVIIARGLKLDYVFVFLASPLNFQNHAAEFEWVLANFKASPGDHAGVQMPVSGENATSIFDGRGLGFTVGYPSGWIAERQGDHAVVISGKPGAPEYFATIHLQNIKMRDARVESENAVSVALQRLKSQIISADRNAEFSGEGPYVYTKPGTMIHGGQFTVTYNQEKVSYKQWTIIIPRPNEDIIHVWSYAAPAGQFLKYGAVARIVLDSWTINP